MKNLAKFLLIASLISLVNASNENECNGGKASACFSVAKEYDKDENTDKAIEFYKKACELNYVIGCNKVGEKYLNLKNNEYAKMFFSKACALNHHESCVSYGEIFENEGNCDMASEIYKDTFKNKKFKPAQSKFEALIGSEKCMSEELKKQKEEGEKARAEIEIAKAQIEVSKQELEIAKQQLNSQNSKQKMSKGEILEKIFTRDTIGSTIAYLEQFTGIPKKVNNYGQQEVREYHIEDCIVNIYGTNNDIRSLELEVSNECTFNISEMMNFDSKYYAHQLTFDKVYDVLGEYGTKFTSDCLYLCGNAYQPSDYLEYRGPHVDNWIEVQFSTDGYHEGSSCWEDYMIKHEGEEYVIEMKFNTDKKYDKIAYQCFKGEKISKIRIGYGIFNN